MDHGPTVHEPLWRSDLSTAEKGDKVRKMEFTEFPETEVDPGTERAVPWRMPGQVAQSWRPAFPRSLLQATSNGMNSTLYRHLGAHPDSVDGITGTKFVVWAPNARDVSVICDANAWTHGKHPLNSSDSG